MGMQILGEYHDSPPVMGRAWDFIWPEQPDGVEDDAWRDVLHRPAFFFIHGGGWRAGTRDGFHKIISELVRRGHPCATTAYRLSDIDVAGQVTDVRLSYARFVQRLRERGHSGAVVPFGSSAGGHLAMLLTLAEPDACGDTPPEDEALLEACRVRPVGVAAQAAPITFEPWEDIFPGSWTAFQRAIGVPYEDHPERYRQASPIEHVDESSPPVYLMLAENEHMFPHRESQRLVKKMQQSGRRAETRLYPSTEHGFFYELSRWQQREALEDLVTFAESLVGAVASRPR